MNQTAQFRQNKSSIIISIFFMLISPFSLASTPVINFWYGDTQNFGQEGNPQNWVNIVGNISFTEGNNIEYSVNGETTKPLKVGPDRGRLIGLGDFNIGIDHNELNQGTNVVKISVLSGNNELASKTVTINYTSGNTWPLPSTVNWSQLNSIQNVGSVAQVVDGLWKLEPEGIRTDQKDSVLTIAIGDETWPTDYEVTVPFTTHSNFNGLGFALGWKGHTRNRNLPIEWPIQALAWIRGTVNNNPPSLEIMTYGGLDRRKKGQTGTQPVYVERNKKYFLKARSESIGNGLSQTDVKFWAQGEDEPTSWMISADVPTYKGSILLVAYKVDMTFGNLTIEELNGDSTPNPTKPPVGSGSVTSDDFNGELNTNLWSIYTPQNDSSSITTTDSQLQIPVSAGTNHDLWTGNLNAPRITQPITNTDFQLEAKFDSSVTTRYQMQGIVVEEDPNNLLRFEFHNDGSTTNIFSASIVNGTARKRLINSIDSNSPLYLRVTRIGSQWTTSYSYNGSAWGTADSFSHDLTVSTAGLFAGNSGNPAPAHTAVIDYFKVDDTPFDSDSIPTPDSELPVDSENGTSDNFNESLNTTLWNTYAPQGDTSITSTESQIQFSVPAGTNHDLWTNKLNAPRITQKITDTNFELEAKFDSPVTDKYQMQGIIVEQDHDNLLRFEFHSDGSTTNIFAASIVTGKAEKRFIKSVSSGSRLYLRVTRIGDQWTTNYSYNGSLWNTAGSFSHDLTVYTAGLFAGNSGNPAPAHTAIIDYFKFTNK